MGLGAVQDESISYLLTVPKVPFEDLRQTTQPTADAANAALEQLSAQQRAALVRLLETKMGGVE